MDKHPGMESLRELYRVGYGPSSSHTMGPAAAAVRFREETEEADAYRAILYGSLAKTGKGHQTDYVIRKKLTPIPTEIVFDTETPTEKHPNTMDLVAFKNGVEIARRRVYSIGGGKILFDGEEESPAGVVYPEETFSEIVSICRANGWHLPDYVEAREGPEIFDYLGECLDVMERAMDRGLNAEGVLPGGLGVERRAGKLYKNAPEDETPMTRENRLVCAYAFAVGEQNAAASKIVTAPTCGACGVLPAVLRYASQREGFDKKTITRAMAAAGVIGNLIKHNASISGAECGCQAEIGSACAMAAAALAELYQMRLEQIEYAAEICIEHHLGLTCDPICGLVQIPCIERNAVAAMRAINAVDLARFLTDSRKISFDLVVRTMYETGRDLSGHYRETSEGGLAKLYL